LAEYITVSGEAGFRLTDADNQVIETCLVANHKTGSTLIRVDYPQAFVIMAFREPFDVIYDKMIEPAVTAAGLECERGDDVLRINDLTANVWDAMLRAGLIIAEVSDPNPNVYYELGLAHALGKDTLILKQHGVDLPADIQGAHYHEYDPNDLAAEVKRFKKIFQDWAETRGAAKVKELLDA
jgi:hypothetical protein